MKSDNDLRALEGLRGGVGDPPNRPGLTPAAAMAAGREPIGMWPLLVWAFRREWVRFSCGSLFRPGRVSQSSMAWAMAAGESGERGGAEEMDYDFAPCCHVDALEVYGAVLLVMDDEPDGEAKRRAFQLLIKHAEAGMAPVWDPPVPDIRIRPMLRTNGKVQHFFSKRGHAIACALAYEGFPDDERRVIRAAARVRYEDWCRLMDGVIDMLGVGAPGLKRFIVNGLGVARSPWRGIADHAA